VNSSRIGEMPESPFLRPGRAAMTPYAAGCSRREHEEQRGEDGESHQLAFALFLGRDTVMLNSFRPGLTSNDSAEVSYLVYLLSIAGVWPCASWYSLRLTGTQITLYMPGSAPSPSRSPPQLNEPSLRIVPCTATSLPFTVASPMTLP